MKKNVCIVGLSGVPQLYANISASLAETIASGLCYGEKSYIQDANGGGAMVLHSTYGEGK